MTSGQTKSNRAHPTVGLLIAAIAALAALLTLFADVAAAADYQLGTMDRLHIRVAEWRTAEGAVRDWATVNGDYTVGPSGNISVPFIGELPVGGKTTAELAKEIGDQLQQKFGLIDRPDASVELAEFRPFFVSGDVQMPGKYPYAPGLTVLKAVSLAGGVRRSADSGANYLRNFINARGQYEVLVVQKEGLIAKRARLLAEAEEKADIDFPEELNKTATGKKLITDETAYRAAREKRLTVQLKAIDDLKKLLQAEIESLEQKIATQNRQIDLSKEELTSIGNLKQQGLVVNQRILNLERQTADLQGQVLDMETAALRAKQDITKATQDAANLQSDRDTGIAQERQDAEADIQAVELKLNMYRDLMTEAMSNDPQAALSVGGGAPPATTYSIVREKDGKTSETTADENTTVLPGDVVKVSIAVMPGTGPVSSDSDSQ